MYDALEAALAANDPDATQDAIYELGAQGRRAEVIDDEIAFQILAILRRVELQHSPLAGHLLNFFEFESRQLSIRAKDRCAAFLREWGGEFTDVLAMQVVGELQHGAYLKTEPSHPARRKPRHVRS